MVVTTVIHHGTDPSMCAVGYSSSGYVGWPLIHLTFVLLDLGASELKQSAKSQVSSAHGGQCLKQIIHSWRDETSKR